MIEFPKRSVTRFFIPLIDVLILLFCIFLLMPMVDTSGKESGLDAKSKELADLKAQRDQLLKKGQAPDDLERKIAALQKDIERLHEGSVLVRVLDLKPGSPELYPRDPKHPPFHTPEDAKRMIERDREDQRRKGDQRKIHYVILDNRDALTEGTLEKLYLPKLFVEHGAEVSVVGPAQDTN